MEAIHSFEASVLKRATRRHIPEDGILRKTLILQIEEDESSLRQRFNIWQT
jgi:hypothetical protein